MNKRGLIKLFLGLILLVIVLLLIIAGLGYYIYNKGPLVNTDGPEVEDCEIDSDCPEDYVCYNSQLCSNLLEGVVCNAQTGDLKCHKLCEADSDCSKDMPYCEEIGFISGDAIGLNNICVVSDCAEEGEQFSKVYVGEYPESCCEGLIEWDSGFDTREVVNGECVETGMVSGWPVGTCLNCGNSVCEDIENVCNCPEDC